jgi:hypothetical protein
MLPGITVRKSSSVPPPRSRAGARDAPPALAALDAANAQLLGALDAARVDAELHSRRAGEERAVLPALRERRAAAEAAVRGLREELSALPRSILAAREAAALERRTLEEKSLRGDIACDRAEREELKVLLRAQDERKEAQEEVRRLREAAAAAEGGGDELGAKEELALLSHSLSVVATKGRAALETVVTHARTGAEAAKARGARAMRESQSEAERLAGFIATATAARSELRALLEAVPAVDSAEALREIAATAEAVQGAPGAGAFVLGASVALLAGAGKRGTSDAGGSGTPAASASAGASGSGRSVSEGMSRGWVRDALAAAAQGRGGRSRAAAAPPAAAVAAAAVAGGGLAASAGSAPPPATAIGDDTEAMALLLDVAALPETAPRNLEELARGARRRRAAAVAPAKPPPPPPAPAAAAAGPPPPAAVVAPTLAAAPLAQSAQQQQYSRALSALTPSAGTARAIMRALSGGGNGEEEDANVDDAEAVTLVAKFMAGGGDFEGAGAGVKLAGAAPAPARPPSAPPRAPPAPVASLRTPWHAAAHTKTSLLRMQRASSSLAPPPAPAPRRAAPPPADAPPPPVQPPPSLASPERLKQLAQPKRGRRGSPAEAAAPAFASLAVAVAAAAAAAPPSHRGASPSALAAANPHEPRAAWSAGLRGGGPALAAGTGGARWKSLAAGGGGGSGGGERDAPVEAAQLLQLHRASVAHGVAIAAFAAATAEATTKAAAAAAEEQRAYEVARAAGAQRRFSPAPGGGGWGWASGGSDGGGGSGGGGGKGRSPRSPAAPGSPGAGRTLLEQVLGTDGGGGGGSGVNAHSSPALGAVLQAAAKLLQGRPGVMESVDSGGSELLKALLQAQAVVSPVGVGRKR